MCLSKLEIKDRACRWIFPLVNDAAFLEKWAPPLQRGALSHKTSLVVSRLSDTDRFPSMMEGACTTRSVRSVSRGSHSRQTPSCICKAYKPGSGHFVHLCMIIDFVCVSIHMKLSVISSLTSWKMSRLHSLGSLSLYILCIQRSATRFATE